MHNHSNRFPKPGDPVSYTHIQTLEGYVTQVLTEVSDRGVTFPHGDPHKDT